MWYGVKCYNFVTILLLFYSFIRYIYTIAYCAGGCGARHRWTLFPVGGGESVEHETEGLVVGFEFGDAFVFLFEE